MRAADRSLADAIRPRRWRVAALLTCHDRRELTIRCLASLEDAEAQATERAAINVFLVDDGCSDGTGMAVRDRFPRVLVIPGTGELFWCGGMRLAWQNAAKGAYDAYLWLNDDVAIDASAIERLVDVAERHRREDGAVIVVGATRAEGEEGGMTYGGLGENGVLASAEVARRIELFNGNIVLVSRRAYEILGGLSPAYTHALGDIDYGIRAKRHGVPAWLAQGSLGSCAANKVARWQRHELPLWTRLRELHRPTGCPPWQLARLIWSNGGWWFPWSVLKLYWQVVFPRQRTARR